MISPRCPRSGRIVVVCLCMLGSLLMLACSGSSAKKATDLYSGLSPANREQAGEAVQKALETRLSQSKLEWRDSQGNLKGSVTPLRTFKNLSGEYCRVYREVVYARPADETATRVACRNGKGIWEQVEG
ncbi:MAG: hypothetical protein QNJ30_24230 [Kiloniellales bacterium]|nr:hypothetical protein [Kiloniellales bacterium]